MTMRPNDRERTNATDAVDARDASFDAAARATHDTALQRVSARVEAQLHQRRRAALSGRASGAAPRPLWPMLAVGGTAALALVIGLRFVHDTGPADPSATHAPSVASSGTPPADASSTDAPSANAHSPTNDSATTALAMSEEAAMAEVDRWLDEIENDDEALLAANDDAMFAALDENPDLYVWLGSEENSAGATESL